MRIGKRVAVLGLGVSGFESALFLKQNGCDVFASDQGQSSALDQRLKALKNAGVECEAGKHTLDRILDADWILISPGISPESPVYKAVKEEGLPIISEIELASWFSATKNVIAVTGSSGKTTVTTLIARLLEKAGKKVFLCGNIGTPWIQEISKIKETDFVALEVSSFQLMHCQSFRPHIGLLLNLAPNHQDWHKDMQEYADAKFKIFTAQKNGDFALLRKADQKAFFSKAPLAAKVFYLDENAGANPNREALERVAGILGISPKAVEEVWSQFSGIEHRLEKFLNAGGVQYVNDSKSTTTSSLAWGLEKFPDKRVILLAGGHPKSNDFDAVRALLQKKAKLAVLIGEAKPLLRSAWDGACPLADSENFQDAVRKACRAAEPGDVVLLSPACASFDMFSNYLERGNLFKKLAAEYAAVPVKAASPVS